MGYMTHEAASAALAGLALRTDRSIERVDLDYDAWPNESGDYPY